MIAVFNKETGKFLFFVDLVGNLQEKYTIKDVGYVNVVEDTFIGDSETGKVVKYDSDEYRGHVTKDEMYDEKPVITEGELKARVRDRITNKHGYKIHDQINIIMDALADAKISSPEFRRMRETIKTELDNYRQTVQTFSEDTDNFDFIPAEKSNDYINRQIELQLLNNL